MSISPDTPSPHYPVRPDWLALHEEAVIEPELPIIDAHHHLWERPESRYLFLDYLEDIRTGHNIQASLFMECGTMYRKEGPAELRCVGEIEFAVGNGAMGASGAFGDCRVCQAIIGFGDLLLGDRLEPVLDALIAASGGRMRGVRQIAAWHEDPAARGSLASPPPHMLLDPGFRRGMAVVDRAGLTFDTFAYHTQLGELADLAKAFPGTPIVVNHAGGAIGVGPYADRRNEVFSAWKAGMKEIAQFSNTYVKLGGLGMKVFGHGFGDRPRPPSSEDLASAWRPYIETCIEAFGPARCMFESNFPVDKGSCSYPTLWNAFKRICAGASPEEKSALFFNTAQRVYRIAQR